MADPQAVASCEQVLSLLRKTGLNFVSQETPYSVYLTIRKKFAKDFQNPTLYCNEENSEKKIYKLENENVCLRNDLEKNVHEFEKVKNENSILETKLESAEREIKSLTDAKQIECKRSQDFSAKMSELKKNISNEEEKVKILEKNILELETKNRNLTKELKILKEKSPKSQEHQCISTQTEQDASKEEELDKIMEEKVKLEDKVNSLLDILYGCHGCGLMECECKESVDEENLSEGDHYSGGNQNFPQDHHSEENQNFPPSQTLTSLVITPLESVSPPWTPPPTPPCFKCGAENYGPSPDIVCFSCLPPLQSKPQTSTSSSPSQTPPGTPPLSSRET